MILEEKHKLDREQRRMAASQDSINKPFNEQVFENRSISPKQEDKMSYAYRLQQKSLAI